MISESLTSESQQSLKRKGSEIDASDFDSQQPSKKTKDEGKFEAPGNVAPVVYSNMTIPASLALPLPTPGTVKISAWNVAGLRAAQKKGFKIYITVEQPDILILTETKVNEIPMDVDLDPTYAHRYWNIASKKGYAGTAVYSKIKPLSVKYTLPDVNDADIVTGRLVILEFASCFVIGTYVPNAGEKLKTMDKKLDWQQAFELEVRRLDVQKPVIWTGDINCVPESIDLKNPKPNWNKTAGHTAQESNFFRRFLNPPESEEAPKKFVDVWRLQNPTKQAFTYFSFGRKCREKGIGWRLDMFVVSERLYDRVKTCDIRGEVYGASDHLPIVMEIDKELLAPASHTPFE